MRKVRIAIGAAAVLVVALAANAVAHPNSHGDCTHGSSGGLAQINGTGGNDICFAVENAGSQVFLGVGTDKVYGYGYSENMYGENGNDTLLGLGSGDSLIGGSGQDDMAGDSGNDNIYGDTPGNNERTCDGGGSDYIDIEDNEGGDTLYRYPDGVAEQLVATDPGDTIVVDAQCPF